MFFIPVYILILLFTIVIDYYAGIWIEEAKEEKKWSYLLMSLIANVGVLAVFKYYNFFTDNVNEILTWAGITSHPVPYLNIILPIGLSFHTFQAMSYTIEIYLENQKAERHFGIYALYVMFYPQLVAGPIERPQNILHQFYEEHEFDSQKAVSGLQLMMWGMFKKLVVADRLGWAVDIAYTHPERYSGLELIVATVFFAFQVYCDFSGYSDIARGSARIMGFDLMKNFNFPYFSKSLAEYWRRWHMSLFSWFTDYVFTPLSFRLYEYGIKGTILAVMITFLLSGFWHGAGWTYIFWGGLLGLGVAYDMSTKNIRKKWAAKISPAIYGIASTLLLFIFICFTDVFFRATSLTQAFSILHTMLMGSDIPYWQLSFGTSFSRTAINLGILFGFVVLEYNLMTGKWIHLFLKQPTLVKWGVYYAVAILLLLFMGDQQSFIYFQF
jgi:alginate O-acetyltransferase complex protein AlgI